MPGLVQSTVRHLEMDVCQETRAKEKKGDLPRNDKADS